MARKRINVTKESDSGRNQKFHDNRTGDDMTRSQFVKKSSTATTKITMYETSMALRLRHLIPILPKTIILIEYC